MFAIKNEKVVVFKDTINNGKDEFNFYSTSVSQKVKDSNPTIYNRAKLPIIFGKEVDVALLVNGDTLQIDEGWLTPRKTNKTNKNGKVIYEVALFVKTGLIIPKDLNNQIG